MPEIPDYQSLQLPLLRLCADGTMTLRAAVQALSETFHLTAEQMLQKLPSGQAVIYNRTGWAKTELVKAGLIQQPQRGQFDITDQGRALLAEKPDRISRQFLMRYPGFKAYIEASQQRPATKEAEASGVETPSVGALEPSTQHRPSGSTPPSARSKLSFATKCLIESSPSRIAPAAPHSSRTWS